MIDAYLVILILALAAIAGVLMYAFMSRKRQQPNLSLRAYPAYPPHRAGHYNPGVTIVETNSGFSEGVIAGAMYAQQRPVIDETVVVVDDPTQYQAAQMQDDPSSASAFSGFSGGDSGGGGATSSWDAPSDSGSCDTGSSDSSSSCDSGSSDSGGSSGDC